jgi:hypothetical protein
VGEVESVCDCRAGGEAADDFEFVGRGGDGVCGQCADVVEEHGNEIQRALTQQGLGEGCLQGNAFVFQAVLFPVAVPHEVDDGMAVAAAENRRNVLSAVQGNIVHLAHGGSFPFEGSPKPGVTHYYGYRPVRRSRGPIRELTRAARRST